MTKETYASAIKAARERYREAMEGAAADVVYICATYGKARRTVCREIAGDEGYNALDHRARAFEKAAGQTAEEARRTRDAEWRRVRESHARNALKDPEMAAKVLAAAAREPRVRDAMFDALERTETAPVARPSHDPAPTPTPSTRNVAALGALSRALDEIRRANASAAYGRLSEHQAANAEVIIRSLEGEIAVWREAVGGGISDDAIAAFLEEEVH